MKRKLMLGNGGHARVLVDVLRERDELPYGFATEHEPAQNDSSLPWVGTDKDVISFNSNEWILINGIGGKAGASRRQEIYDRFTKSNFEFLSIIHPNAFISKDVDLETGAQIMAGAIIQPGTAIGINSIINTGSSVDHDCKIGNHNHIAPGATICGGVEIGNYSHIGAGASVIEGVSIGQHCVVGAGAVVISDIPDCHKAIGVPAVPVNIDSRQETYNGEKLFHL
jgi:sugar O-acyltransferase (sialic acid O-acetyltransferase NeuD family)